MTLMNVWVILLLTNKERDVMNIVTIHNITDNIYSKYLKCKGPKLPRSTVLNLMEGLSGGEIATLHNQLVDTDVVWDGEGWHYAS